MEMQFILCHLDNNAPVINTLERDLRDVLDDYELQIFAISTRSDFDEVRSALEKIVARLAGLRRTEPDFLQFLGGLFVMLMNMRYDPSFQHNICGFDIGDDGKLRWGRKRVRPDTERPPGNLE